MIKNLQKIKKLKLLVLVTFRQNIFIFPTLKFFHSNKNFMTSKTYVYEYKQPEICMNYPVHKNSSLHKRFQQYSTLRFTDHQLIRSLQTLKFTPNKKLIDMPHQQKLSIYEIISFRKIIWNISTVFVYPVIIKLSFRVILKRANELIFGKELNRGYWIVNFEIHY